MLDHIKNNNNQYLTEWWDIDHKRGYDKEFIRGMYYIRKYESSHKYHNERKEECLDFAKRYFEKCIQKDSKDYMKAEYFYGMAVYCAYKYDFENYHEFYQNLKKIDIEFFQYNSDCIKELNEKIDKVYFNIKEVEDICDEIKEFIRLYQICVYQLTYDEFMYECDEYGNEIDEDVEDLYYYMINTYSNDSEKYIQAGIAYLNMIWYMRYSEFAEVYKYAEKLKQISSNDEFVHEIQNNAVYIVSEAQKREKIEMVSDAKNNVVSVNVDNANTIELNNNHGVNNQNKIIIALAVIIIVLLGVIIYIQLK